MVVLISNDNIRFDVKLEQIMATDTFPMLSRTLKNMVEICQNCEILEIDVNSDILQKIIEYCQLQYQNPPKFVDSCDDSAIRDMVEHCEWHMARIKNNNENINENTIHVKCEYTNKTIFRTWKNSVTSNGEKIKQMMIHENLSRKEIDLLWEHIENLHSSSYCCSEDYHLYLKNSTHTEHIVPKWSENFLTPFMKDIIDGKSIQDSFIGKLYFSSEYLEVSGLCDDITTLLSNYIHNLIINDTQCKTILSHLFELPDDQITNPELLSLLVKQVVP